jgi:hypothetical protein
MTSSAQPDRRPALSLAGIELDRLALPGLVASVLASGFLLYHLTRGTSFYVDDWNFITGRRGDTVATFLAPYQGHLSVVPIAIYRLMFAAFGISSYAPYRALVIALSLIVGLLVYDYARHRVGDFIAMLTAALILFLGPGWQDTMWAFQIAWLLALGAGIAALIMLDRRTLATDIAACALTLAAICSTSFGVAFAIGIAADIALTRRRWRDAWIPAIPLLLYAIWALHYHPTGIQWSAITLVPGNLAQAFAGGSAALVGLSGATPSDPTGTALTFGVPIAVGLVIWTVRSALRRQLSGRAVALLVALAAFSALTTLGRAFETPLVSRYIYPDCVLIALFCVELARGLRPSRTIQAALAVAALLAVISNVGVMRSGGAYLRQVGAQTNADLTALELARDQLPPGYIATHLPDYPFIAITAGSYFAAARDLGTPADSVAQVARAPATARDTADQELISSGAIVLSSGRSPAPTGGAAPAVDSRTDATTSRAGACTRVLPAAAVAPGAGSSAELSLGPGAFRVRTGAGTASIAARRFGPTSNPLGTVGPDRSALVLVRHDAAPQPWHLQLVAGVAVEVCRLQTRSGG